MIQVWDLALRLFHWLLAFAIVIAIVTGKAGGSYLYWHTDIGIFILSLLVFRIFWGILGTEYALFMQFFPTIARLRAFFSSQWSGVGHNPITGLYVVIMLCMLTAQVTFGLFCFNEDMDFSAPLSAFVSYSQRQLMSNGHILLSTIIILLVVIHIVAVGFHWVAKGENLVFPMITGKKRNHDGMQLNKYAEINRTYLLISFGAAVLAALIVKVVSYQSN